MKTVRETEVELVELGGGGILNFRRSDLPRSPLDIWDASDMWRFRAHRLSELWDGTADLSAATIRAASCNYGYEVPGTIVPRNITQLDQDHCVPACAEMIMYRFGNTLDQEAIADKMCTVVTSPPGQGGTTLPNELKGYSEILGKGRAYPDYNPSFQDVTNSIGTLNMPGLPFKAGTGTHAIVVIGWKACLGSSDLKAINPLGKIECVPVLNFANFVYVQ